MAVRAVALAVLAVMLVGVAQATSPPTRLQRDRALAVERWGVPCMGERIEVYMTPLSDAWNAFAKFDGDKPPYSNCRILLNSRFVWPTLKLCTIMVHEYGHLHGFFSRRGVMARNPITGRWFRDYAHSPNWQSVMFPIYVRPWPPCRGVFPRARH